MLAAHGHPSYTGDIDFWVRPAADKLARLLDALKEFGFGSLGLGVSNFDTDTVVQLSQPSRRIDNLTAINGVAFDECFARREQLELDGVCLGSIGLADFKTNKRASGRLKYLADLESLEPPTDA